MKMKRVKRKVIKELQKTDVVDFETGEIKSSNEIRRTFSVSKEPAFVKMYLDDLGMLHGLSRSNISVLHSLLKHMNFADDDIPQAVLVNSFLKKQILMENPNLNHTQTVTNSISELKKAGILEELGRGAYRFNPFLFGRGEWKDIEKLREIKVTLIYDETGKSMSVDSKVKKESESTESNEAKKETTTTESATETKETTETETKETTEEHSIRRSGRRGTPKPADWAEVKVKILNGEITRNKYCKDNHISVNTLRKWLNEND